MKAEAFCTGHLSCTAGAGIKAAYPFNCPRFFVSIQIKLRRK
jgi:hypothetical protein